MIPSRVPLHPCGVRRRHCKDAVAPSLSLRDPSPVPSPPCPRADYTLTVDGEPVPVRRMDYCSFALLTATGPREARVEVGFDFSRCTVRPLGHGITPRVEGRTVELTLPRHDRPEQPPQRRVSRRPGRRHADEAAVPPHVAADGRAPGRRHHLRAGPRPRRRPHHPHQRADALHPQEHDRSRRRPGRRRPRHHPLRRGRPRRQQPRPRSRPPGPPAVRRASRLHERPRRGPDAPERAELVPRARRLPGRHHPRGQDPERLGQRRRHRHRRQLERLHRPPFHPHEGRLRRDQGDRQGGGESGRNPQRPPACGTSTTSASPAAPSGTASGATPWRSATRPAATPSATSRSRTATSSAASPNAGRAAAS